jgi:hypothetical protein
MLVGEDIFKDTNDEFSSGGGSSPRAQFSVKAPKIEKIFKEILGRKPSSRELAYYKYGVMKEDDIRLKLIKSEEHKKILDDATKLPNIETELKDVRISERKLNQKIEDLLSESDEREKLLLEQNSVIKELREKVQNPYNFPTQAQKYEEGFDVFSNTRPVISNLSREKKKTFKDALLELIEVLLK